MILSQDPVYIGFIILLLFVLVVPYLFYKGYIVSKPAYDEQMEILNGIAERIVTGNEKLIDGIATGNKRLVEDMRTVIVLNQEQLEKVLSGVVYRATLEALAQYERDRGK